MWNSSIKSLNGGRVRQLAIYTDDGVLSYAAVLAGWCSNPEFRAFFNRLLADAPFAACFWETPPLTRVTLGQPFECMLVDSPALAGVNADRAAFAEYCDAAEALVADFPNLGGDAQLVAPCPQGTAAVYPHLATFVRNAPAVQQQALWQRVGECVHARLSERPLWVSTAGLGIYWLHVRLDSSPKYYSWRPYTQA